MQPDDQLGTGRVWHRRRQPRVHAFEYRLWYSLIDVDRLEQRFSRSKWWSVERMNLVTFRRRDYLGDPNVELSTAVRDRVAESLGARPEGPVRMLTHLRQWGMCFNPVTFYFCHAGDGRLAAIVADVHNTPWGDRHAYVLDARRQDGPRYRFAFGKQFHVSPFLPMNLSYDWRFDYPSTATAQENPGPGDPERLSVHMLVTDSAGQCLTVGMRLALAPLDSRSMLRMPLQFPLMALKVLGAIYWQALRLALKRTPFHDHPGSGDRPVADSGEKR